MEALTEFAVRTFASDLATSVSVTAGGQTPVQKSVDATNRLLLQEAKVPELTVSHVRLRGVSSLFNFMCSFLCLWHLFLRVYVSLYLHL